MLMYLLLAPFKIIIDSHKGYLMLGWNRWLKASVSPDDDYLGIQVDFPFWKKHFLIEKMILQRAAIKKKEPKRTKSKFHFMKFSWKKVQRILKRVKIKEFAWSLDTNDFIRNAYLVPIFELMSYRTGYHSHINFIGKNEIRFRAESRIINMLMASIF